MREITLEQLFVHPIAQKYLSRSGLSHAVAVAYHCFHLSVKGNLDVDSATKAGLLHDLGHYTWYKDGKWDYDLYKKNDIHAIKGAERAHKLLIRLGENPIRAKEIAVAILLHTDSYLPEAMIVRTPLQEIVKLADELDEEADGGHHRRNLEFERALQSIKQLDKKIDDYLKNKDNK